MRGATTLAWTLLVSLLIVLRAGLALADSPDAGADAGASAVSDAGANVSPDGGAVAAGTGAEGGVVAEDQGPFDAAAWALPDQDALLGLPLRAVEVVSAAPASIDNEVRPLLKGISLPAVTSAKIGQPFTRAMARAAMREVLATGQFGDANAAAVREGDGVRLVVEVTGRKVIVDARVITLGARFDSEELLREAGLSKGRETSWAKVAEHRRKLLGFLEERGYPRANVALRFRLREGEPRHVTVVVQVVAGPAVVARSRDVVYLRADGKRDTGLLRRPPSVTRAVEAYAVTAGMVLDETKLGAEDSALRARLVQLGYRDAELQHSLEPLPDGSAKLVLSITLGPLIVLRFEGNDNYDDDALRGALALADEPDRSSLHLASKIREFYVARGYLDAEVIPQEIGGADDRRHVLVLRVFEHERIGVRARHYPCFSSEALRGVKLDLAPRTAKAIGTEIDSFLEEELPGEDLLRSPRPSSLARTVGGAANPVDPADLDPAGTYAPGVYERAVAHVRDLYRADGYLSVEVGPVAVVRRRCKKTSRAGTCEVVEAPRVDDDALCAYDGRGLPKPVPDPSPEESCVPDPEHHLRCEPQVSLRIPIKLGPRAILYDVAFSGVESQTPAALLAKMQLDIGRAASTVKLEEARRRLIDIYREEGYVFAEARFALDFSTDHTRVRARFEVSEGPLVLVRDVVVRGLERTAESLVRKRVALVVGERYRASLVRRTEERVALLGVFGSVSVSLENPLVPEKRKTVIVEVTERTSQVAEFRAGFSSGQGLRLGGEYGHRNIAGRAVSLTLLAELSYLPTFFIKEFIRDPTLEENFVEILGDPAIDKRTATRLTASLQFPETGLGPLFRGVLDGVFVHDLQRDYYVRKFAVIPSLAFTPDRRWRFSLGQSVELNSVRIFQGGNIDGYLGNLAEQGNLTPDRVSRLLVPDGSSLALAQKLTAAWDRRDNSLDATRGTFVALTMEHVDAFPQDREQRDALSGLRRQESHFLKIVQTVSGYVPIYKRLRLALSMRIGANVQLTPNSVTYPDRLFFMGGTDSMRAWYQQTLVPQDDADQIDADRSKPSTIPNPNAGQPGQPEQIPNPEKFTILSRPVRGGNLLFNPRAELRIPLSGAVETAMFLDVGNLWTNIQYPFETGQIPVRYAVGTGLRLQTPVFPIVFDVGFNPSRRVYERAWAFNFAIGLY